MVHIIYNHNLRFFHQLQTFHLVLKFSSKNLCCFVDMPLYSNSSSTIALNSSKIISEVFTPFFSCSKKLNLLQSSLGLDDKNIVFDSSADSAVMACGDWINLLRDLSLVLCLSKTLLQNTFPLRIQTLVFFCETSNGYFIVFISYHFQKTSMQFELFICITESHQIVMNSNRYCSMYQKVIDPI